MKVHPLFEELIYTAASRIGEMSKGTSMRDAIVAWRDAGKPVVLPVEEEPERRLFQQTERLNLMEEIAQKDAKIRELEEKLAETSSWDEVCALSMKRWGENLALTTEAGTNQIRNAALDEVIGPLFAYFNSVPYSGCSPHDLAARIRALKK